MGNLQYAEDPSDLKKQVLVLQQKLKQIEF